MDEPLPSGRLAEFCAVVEGCPDVFEALVVDADGPGQNGVRLLFVVMRPGVVLDDALRVEINRRLRACVPPWWVPNAIYAVSDLPRASDGAKHVEAVQRILTGVPWENAGGRKAVENPEALRYFADLFNNL